MRRNALILLVTALVAAACGGGSDDAESDSAPATPAPAATNAAASENADDDALDESTGDTDQSGPAGAGAGDAASNAANSDEDTPAPAVGDSVDGVELSAAPGWNALAIGEGVKPVLALDDDEQPGIAYLLEDFDGFIAFADAASEWEPVTVTEGYFYGPIGLDFTPDGAAVIAYHDHQADSFDQALGDLTVATEVDDGWQVEAIEDEGHDGWDSTVVIAEDGIVRAAGIDPQQFERQSGVEYFELGPDGWDVTEIGSGPIAYEFNVGLAVGADREPAVTYYDNNTETLQYAVRSAGAWTIETVDADGSVGRYSSLVFDSAGDPHVSYVDLTGPTTATVRYATRTGGDWVIEDVTDLDAILPGFTGARRVTHIAIGADDTPHIVFGDESTVGYGVRGEAGWELEPVVAAGDARLGQLVTFALASDGTPHVALFEVTSSNPLNGTVVYLTR